MVKPGIYECTYDELQPVLQKLLEPHLAPNDPILLCMTKFWDGQLCAFLVTGGKSLLASWDTLSATLATSQSVYAVPFRDIAGINEIVQDTPLLTREHCIELWGHEDLSAPLATFAFLRTDALYQKFCSLLHERIEYHQKLLDAGQSL